MENLFSKELVKLVYHIDVETTITMKDSIFLKLGRDIYKEKNLYEFLFLARLELTKYKGINYTIELMSYKDESIVSVLKHNIDGYDKETFVEEKEFQALSKAFKWIMNGSN